MCFTSENKKVSSCQKTERHAEKSYQRTSAGFTGTNQPAVFGNSRILADK